MPELPEVESVRRLLAEGRPSLLGSTIGRVEVLRDTVIGGTFLPEQFSHMIVGLVFHEIFRHGKYLFFRLQSARATNSLWMAVHLRMTGRLFMGPESASRAAHTRLVVHLQDGWALRFDDPRAFGRVWLVADPAEVIAGLGPDALMVDEATFLQRLDLHRRQLKPLLLDQSFVAGLGNIYTDESLFRAGMHPLQGTAGLKASQRKRLYQAIHAVMHEAVECKGANIDGVFEAGCFPVAVYGRAGMPCAVCGTSIIKIRVGQRGTHLCPRCQVLKI
jgi:formamidopyrimidine-DNA glycosylase